MSSVTPMHTDAEAYQPRVFGIVAEYESPHDLLEAVKAVRQAGYSRIDTHTPFPIHGMDRAMGLSPTKLPWVVLCGGLSGTASAIALQWWMNGLDYTFRIGGKPYISYQAYVPIGFELTVLFSAITTVLTLLVMSMLPRPYHPLFTHARFGRFSDNGFFLSIEAADPKWNEAKVRSMLEATHGKEISIVRDTSET